MEHFLMGGGGGGWIRQLADVNKDEVIAGYLRGRSFPPKNIVNITVYK